MTQPAGAPPAGPPPRVLIADDERSVRHMLTLHLRRAGVECVEAEDGERALERIRAGGLNAVLCDMLMPGLDGREVIRRARAEGSTVPIVLMSAHADTKTALAAMADGADDFIEKPFRTVEEAVFRVQKVLQVKALRDEVDRLREHLDQERGFAGIVARSEEMQRVFWMVRKVADFKTTVLITGASGTGKELIARALHFEGARRGGPFVAVNCGAIPEMLLESELFGHIRGAFTDAAKDRRGLFEEASGGSLFLDEIGELPHPLQVKLLRVLQEGEIRRVGDSKSTPVDVRVVAATIRDLPAEVAAGRFREDLYYRLNVLPIALPPLVERRDDIPLLVEHFIGRLNARLGMRIQGIEPEALRRMLQFSWPGNVRELENCVERAMVLADSDQITVEALPARIREPGPETHRALPDDDDLSIKRRGRALEEALIRRALARTNGNRTRAAEVLEISHRALLYKIKEYRIDA